MAETIQTRVFRCAAKILGGNRELCDRLRVTPGELSRWLSNQETSPLPVFFRAVDIILASDQGFAAIFTTPRAARLP